MSQVYRESKRTVLCIDDDDAVLASERLLLEEWGYIVLTTESPQWGLTLAALCQLDAVVLDYHMREMNGHAVAVAIKHYQPETLIVMFSATEIPEETRMLLNAAVVQTDAIKQVAPIVTRPIELEES